MWNKILKVVAWLDGKKTYIVSGLSILNGVVQLVNGGHWSQILPYLLAGALGTTIRLAIAKVEALLPKSVQDVVDPIVNDVVNKK